MIIYLIIYLIYLTERTVTSNKKFEIIHYFFTSPRKRIVLQTEISGKYYSSVLFYITSFVPQSLLLAVKLVKFKLTSVSY